jgi:hypothetical protein
MKKTMNLVLLMTGLMLSTAIAASAQTPPPSKRIFADVNFGVQPSSRTFSTEALPVVYNEVAIIRSNQGVDGSSMLDVVGGYNVWRDLSVALGLTTTFPVKNEAQVTGGIPHPLFYDSRVESTRTIEDLEHREQSVHLSAMWTSPVTDKIDASGFAGPSYIKVFQDLVTSVTVPPGTQTFTPASDRQTATVWGFHFGGDFTYLITPRIGVGAMGRFVAAKADLPSVPDLSVGGFQFGGGLRVRF